jgi:hypothetical protein
VGIGGALVRRRRSGIGASGGQALGDRDRAASGIGIGHHQRQELLAGLPAEVREALGALVAEEK